MPSVWSDLDRPPLSARRLQDTVGRGPVWRRIVVLENTGSTNAEVAAAAAQGEPEGLVVLAEQQRSGRGRLARVWESPARAGLLMSGLLRPELSSTSTRLLPLLAGVAVAEALAAVAALPARLKWPNDVMVDGRKLGGILLERTVDGAVVIGIGLNVSTRATELPSDRATSVALAGGVVDREPLAKEVLRALARRYRYFTEMDGAPDSVLPAYRELCETIDTKVVVLRPGGGSVTGVAVAVDDAGRLLVRTAQGREEAWSAGDVVHVREEE